MRLYNVVCGLMLILMAVTKFSMSDLTAEEMETWFVALLPYVGGLELAIGVLFLIGKTPVLCWLAVIVLGSAFALVQISLTVLDGPVVVASRTCGCLGAYRLTFAQHFLLSCAVVAMGAVPLALRSSEGGRGERGVEHG